MASTTTQNGNGRITIAVGDMGVRNERLRRQTVSPFEQLGTTGLKQFGGFVLEEWLRKLSGKQGAWVYREMMDNSAVIGGILFAVEMLARKAEWRVEGSDERMPNGMLATEFGESAMFDMSHTWGDVISEALSMLPFGWAYAECVYKRRNGLQLPSFAPVGETEEDTSPASSEYDDGLIGWRKMPVIAQETLLRWHFQGYSGLKSMEQVDWHGGQHTIPVEKALLFRTKALRNSPEGRSVLRNAVESWYYLREIQSTEAIGIDRDLAGLPKATAPEGVDIFSDAEKDLYERVKAMVTGVRRDELEGLIMPYGWDFELISSGGQRQIKADEVIRRYRQDIASSVLADFILVGLDALGSYAMVDIKSDMFGLAVDATLDSLCDVFNRYGFPRLMRLNGVKLKHPLKLKHSSAGRIDLEKVGNFLKDLALAEAPIPYSKQLLAQLFESAGLPAIFEGESASSENLISATGSEPASNAAGQPIAKADDGTVDVAPLLAQRASLLTAQLEREMWGALRELGGQAATAYMHVAEKADRGLVRAVLNRIRVGDWVKARLIPMLRNHSARVAGDTERVLKTAIDMQVHIASEDVARMQAQAGARLKLADIEPQVREAISKAIDEGLAAGENPTKTASRIREMVPPGRFVHAGSAYRARLIARQETLAQQRLATLAAYRNHPRIEKVQVVDGIYGPPRSDAACLDRAGEIVPLDEAAALAPSLHPQCTVSFNPLITTSVAV